MHTYIHVLNFNSSTKLSVKVHNIISCIAYSPQVSYTYRIAGYTCIGGNVWRIARKRKKIAIGGYEFGGYGTIAMPFPQVYVVGVILLLAV